MFQRSLLSTLNPVRFVTTSNGIHLWNGESTLPVKNDPVKYCSSPPRSKRGVESIYRKPVPLSGRASSPKLSKKKSLERGFPFRKERGGDIPLERAGH
jgi:hypothetical protein